MRTNTQSQAGYMPSPEVVLKAWEMLTRERSRLVALSIVLAARIEEREREQEHDSTELLLAQLLEEHLCLNTTMDKVFHLLTGAPR